MRMKFLASAVMAALAWLPIAGANTPDDELLDIQQQLQAEGYDLTVASLGAAVTDWRESDRIRAWAALALGAAAAETITPEAALEPLSTALADDSADLRQAATQALGGIPNSKTTDLLARALQDPLPGVRRAAVLSLGQTGGPRAVQLLIDKLRDPQELDSGVRAQAAHQLGRLGDPAARPVLRGTLDDPQATVRGLAAVALSELGDPAATEALVTVALDPLSAEWLRVDAIHALERISGERFGYTKPYHAPTTKLERRAALQHVEQWWRDEGRGAEKGGQR